MEPLTVRNRPTSLDQFVGQDHLVGKNKPISNAIKNKHLFSFILWGPPGVGKTTLARIYAKSMNALYFEISAVCSSKDEIKKIIECSNETPNKQLIIFLDEIHRFNKAQQDFLLPFVENGKIILIGATTENPSFEIISPLLSRCQIFTLNRLSEDEIAQIIKNNNFELDVDSLQWIINMANGDARQAISVIDNCIKLYKKVSVKTLTDTLQNLHLNYDKKSDEHYNTISAFIKSMRASNVDAALYYLARMVESGENPLFIARRMVIFASEDIGLADPQAIQIANDIFKAVDTIGYPECSINLAHGVCYLAKAKKNRSSYDAYMSAVVDVKKYGNLPIPLNILNAPTKLMKDLGYGKNYEMYTDKDLLPAKLAGKKYLITQ